MTCGTAFNGSTIANATGARRVGLEQLMPIGFDDITTDFSTTDPYVFNVFFHKFVADDGSTPDLLNNYGQLAPDEVGDGDLIGEEEFLEAIRALNIKYNAFNIFFKYRGYDIIKNSSFLQITDYNSSTSAYQTLKNWVRTNNNPETGAPYYQDNAFNLYIVHHFGTSPLDNTLGVGDFLGTESIYPYKTFQPVGISYNPNPPYTPIDPGAPYDYINHVVPHEIGHNLNLLHTDHNHARWWRFVSQDINHQYDQATFYYSERVTRDVTNTVAPYNAIYAGDQVADTNADNGDNYVSSTTQIANLATCSCNNTIIEQENMRDYSTWTYDSANNHFIATGEYYVDMPLFNIMHRSMIKDITDTSHCNQARILTNGQGTRVRLQILANPSIFDSKMTTLASLYEPYKEIATSGGGGDIVLPSGLTIETGYYWTGNIGYFQPGFDYEVYYCNESTGTVNELNTTYGKYDEIPSYYLPGHTLKILQLGDAFGQCYPFPMVAHPIGGSVYNHTQANYVAQPLDSIEINSPNLLLNLSSGTNTINITTDSGETVQKTILVTP
jgi:hypothetical protein